jgi:hypothetical protein
VAALLAVAGLSLLYAHTQARDADRIRQLAAEKATETRKANLRLAALNYQRGQDECEKEEIGLGLLRLVESWRSAVAAGDLATGWPHAARANLAAWQHQHPTLQAVFSHAGPVWSVAFSPGGKTVITGCEDHTARLWDAATGRPLGQTLKHGGIVHAVAFSPDGKTVLTGSWDHSARLWDAATGRPLGPQLTHGGPVLAVAFSPDGKTLLTGSDDHTARLWDATTGQPRGPTLRHQARVVAVAFSPDGRTVISGSGDRTARLWDVAASFPDELERVATWVEVLTGLELDELGSARVLDSATWLQRREKLKQLGGPPVVGAASSPARRCSRPRSRPSGTGSTSGPTCSASAACCTRWRVVDLHLDS